MAGAPHTASSAAGRVQNHVELGHEPALGVHRPRPARDDLSCGVTHPSRTLTVEIPEAYAQALEGWLRHTSDDGHGSHGAINLRELAELLLEDAALVTLRPGSWEADVMHKLLISHGYKVHELNDGASTG